MEPKHPLHERHDPVMPRLLLGNGEVDRADGRPLQENGRKVEAVALQVGADDCG